MAFTLATSFFGIQTRPSIKLSLTMHLLRVVYIVFSCSKYNLYREYFKGPLSLKALLSLKTYLRLFSILANKVLLSFISF